MSELRKRKLKNELVIGEDTKTASISFNTMPLTLAELDDTLIFINEIEGSTGITLNDNPMTERCNSMRHLTTNYFSQAKQSETLKMQSKILWIQIIVLGVTALSIFINS